MPAQTPVLVDGVDCGGSLADVYTFAHRDLKPAVAAYFDDVQEIAPGQRPDAKPHVIVDVKLDCLEVVITSTAYLRSQVVRSGAAVLTWGVWVRPSKGSVYLFSYPAESAGPPVWNPSFSSARCSRGQLPNS